MSDPTPMSEMTEVRLRAEIEDLRRRLDQQHAGVSATHHKGKRRPSAGVLWTIAILGAGILVAAFFAGYLPQANRQIALAKEAKDESVALPIANVAPVERSSSKTNLVLPGNIQAITEAPVLARATGYVKRRLVDIGDRVKEGQLLAEVDAPELEQQVEQGQALVEQASASLEQATASVQQGKTNADMSRLTADRWNSLVQKGAVARQDADTYKSQYEAQTASVQALEKGVSAAKSNLVAAQANLARLKEVRGHLQVKAPFSGVITLRNVDTGALVNEGSTLLFRIAQTDRLRIFVSVPQGDASAVHVGLASDVTVADLPSRKFKGTVTRTANSLDPATRTLLAEVQLQNGDGTLLPGMFAEVNFTTPRAEPPLIIRGDTLVVRANGPQVAVLRPDDTVHFQTIQLGRDYGDRMEVLGGLTEGQRVVINPGDTMRENTKVKPVLLAKEGAK